MDKDSTYILAYSFIIWTIAVAFGAYEFFEMYERKEIEMKVYAELNTKIQQCQKVITGRLYESE